MKNIPLHCLCLLISLSTFMHADEPVTDPFPLPKDVEIAVPSEADLKSADPKLMEQIGRALEGKPVDPAGNEILQGVLESIRRRGSVLNGSVLDEPPAEVPSPTDPSVTQINARRVKTAHSLLRSARLLESLSDKKSPKEIDLVIQLRRHAVKLLLQTLPPEP